MKKIMAAIALLGLSALILLVSVSRASLEAMAKEDREGNLRVEPVLSEGKIVYKLPPIKMLPNNIFYGVKEMRDWLWRKFSFGEIKKSRTELLIADKKIAESKILIEKENFSLAIESGAKAVDKLKYAKSLVDQTKQYNVEIAAIRKQIRDATAAYELIIQGIKPSLEVDEQKYNELKEKINEFKEEQKKEGWEF